MGTYINKGNIAFQKSRNSEYVDKTELIAAVNSSLNTRQSYMCVSRCRRFGKSMAAEMLCAYYDKSCDSRHLFADLKIAQNPSFEQHLNKYAVIYVDMTRFITRFRDDSIVTHINEEVLADVHDAYPDVPQKEGDDLMALLVRINKVTGEQFFFIIDEWDAICREFKPGTKAMDNYLDWLRSMFKSNEGLTVFAGAYLTGIMPIKKYSTQSAMNRSAQRDACLSKNFQEYSMVLPGNMAGCFGFTKEEVKALAEKHGMDFDELEKWYDGYQIGPVKSVFNPNSVMQAIRNQWCDSYWNKTASYDTVSRYIQMNYDGLKDDIIKMMAGGRCSVDPSHFKNDISEVHSKDDVLTELIHLGYLSYDRVKRECYIPNREVAGEFVYAVEDVKWPYVAEAIKKSERLLEDTLSGNAGAVARGIDLAHDENTSILSYNDENSLACVLSIAYYAARDKYIVHREYDKDADTAISQILRKEYPAKVAEYADRLQLVGVSYDKQEKKHECRIVKIIDN